MEHIEYLITLELLEGLKMYRGLNVLVDATLGCLGIENVSRVDQFIMFNKTLMMGECRNAFDSAAAVC